MADDDLLRVKSIFDGAALRGRDLVAPVKRAVEGPDRRRHREGKREVAAYFRTVEKAAAALNELLTKKNTLYRFRVYWEGDQILIDLIVLDKTGAVAEKRKKNITHEDFARLIEDLGRGEGLMIDSLG
ncbi:MAG: hypothetical protein PHC61_02030 [Chitinivibrionales bacterium]|nr:hypothetical protein [Chitinivibrionales bacterium]